MRPVATTFPLLSRSTKKRWRCSAALGTKGHYFVDGGFEFVHFFLRAVRAQFLEQIGSAYDETGAEVHHAINFANVRRTMTSFPAATTFGQITTQANFPRVFQLGVRFFL
jgi:hypothetical protein